jgi:hypothetical protein
MPKTIESERDGEKFTPLTSEEEMIHFSCAKHVHESLKAVPEDG